MSMVAEQVLTAFEELKQQLTVIRDDIMENFYYQWGKLGNTPKDGDIIKLRACEYRYKNLEATTRIAQCFNKENLLAYFEQNAGLFVDLQNIYKCEIDEDKKATTLCQTEKLREIYIKNGFTKSDPKFNVPLLPDGLTFIDHPMQVN